MIAVFVKSAILLILVTAVHCGVKVITYNCSDYNGNITLIGTKRQLTLNLTQLSKTFEITNPILNSTLSINLCQPETPCPTDGKKSHVCLTSNEGESINNRLSSTLIYNVSSGGEREENITATIKQRFSSPAKPDEQYSMITDLVLTCALNGKGEFTINHVNDTNFRVIEVKLKSLCGVLTKIPGDGDDKEKDREDKDKGKDKDKDKDGEPKPPTGLSGGNVFLIM
jgi:hypothetical protein